MTRERSGGQPSQRQLRVGEQMRHLLAEHLMRGDLHDRHLETVSVTVSEVRMSRDLRHAQVFVAELGQEVQPATLDSLARVAPSLAGRLAREMNLKYAPRLRFEPDTTFSHAARIDSLLHEGLKPHRRADDDDGAATARPARRDER
jgi:ribosome-binding factor A